MSARGPRVDVRRLAVSMAILLVVTAAMLPFRDRLDKAHISLLYLLVVLGTSAFGGRLVGLFIGGAAFLSFNLVFLPPYYTLVIADPLDWLVLITFLVTAIVAAELLDRQRRHAALAEARARETDQLATLGAETLNAARAEQALAAIATVIQRAAGVERCELFVWDDQKQAPRRIAASDAGARAAAERGGAEIAPAPDDGDLLRYVVEARRSAMEWDDGTIHVLDQASDTDRVRGERTRALAMPLASRGQPVGVLRVSGAAAFALSVEQWRVMTALAYYAALGIERLRLERSEETAEALRRADRLKDALLAAVSHDLRTPLTTIKGIAHEIASEGQERAVIIEEEADRLASLVEGLLELSELSAGALPSAPALNTVDDLVGAALQRAEAVLARREADVDLGDPLLVGRFDFTQSLRILVNLLENAAKYSAADAPIRLIARRSGDVLEIAVIDRGRGVPADERERIFQPFYRVPGAQPDIRGAGLGLSIARELARAQGGDLVVEDGDGHGSRFVLRLPAEDLRPD